MMLHKKISRFALFLCCVMLAASTSASANVPSRMPSYQAIPNTADAGTATMMASSSALSVPGLPQTSDVNGVVSQAYVLGVGDKIKLTVFGEGDLSGDYEVGSTGIIALPLIGDVQAAGQPLRTFEASVRDRLAQGYLRDPRVSAQVVNYRPFFILGEVSKPGSYPYVNGMSVLNAVALAGGYTYRADRKEIKLTRANDPAKGEVVAPETAIVMPGDIIRVPERFF